MHTTAHSGLQGSSPDRVLWAHNDNDAKQSWTITALTLGSRKRLNRGTVTHGMWFQTLGVPIGSWIMRLSPLCLQAYNSLMRETGSCWTSSRESRVYSKNTVSRKDEAVWTCGNSWVVLFVTTPRNDKAIFLKLYMFIKPIVWCWHCATGHVAIQPVVLISRFFFLLNWWKNKWFKCLLCRCWESHEHIF